MCFWFILKTTSTASSSTDALVGADSLQPWDQSHDGALVGADLFLGSLHWRYAQFLYEILVYYLVI